MQVSIKWLKDYLDFEDAAEELAEKYTMAGIPVENIVHAGAGLEHVVTGRLAKVVPHPDSDHLLVCTVDVGQAEPLQIVTGAPNVREGQVVPVALVGALLPCGKKISKGKLRGVASHGMLCSADELCLDLEHLPEEQKTGIYILPEGTGAGLPAKDVLGLDDVSLEFELTANRGDCFSVFGLVREAAVLTGGMPRWPAIRVREDSPAKAADLIGIGIDAPDLCSRFSARVLQDVKLGPSPEWMQRRLDGAGIRAINNVVDVTNFVMVELGQPMHAYDYDEIQGHRLTARRALPGELLHTLDDSSRKAKGDELVIADAEKPAGLAGIMGGLETEITGKTTTVVLEAASFNGASIRRTARACGLHSEASGRFERGVDVTGTVRALDRAAQLLQEMGACTVAQGIVDVYPEPQGERAVNFSADAVNARLGTEIPGERMARILSSLGFGMEELGAGSYRAKVPSWRNDVSCMADISEEIARIHGYGKIPATLPLGRTVQGRQSAEQDFVDRAKRILVGLGMSETLSFSFTSEGLLDKLHLPQDSPLRRAIPIRNPLTDEYPLVRTTLLSGIFETALRNYSRKNEDFGIFEIAPVFLPDALPLAEQPKEPLMLAGLLMGRRNPMGWDQGKDEADFYDMKGIVEELLAGLSIAHCTVEPGEHYAMHPGKTAVFRKGRDVIATVGEVHPAVAAAFGIQRRMCIFEMEIATLMRYTAKSLRYEPLPRYPAIARDLAMLVDEGVAAGDVQQAIEKSGGKLLRSVELFDVYTGKQVAAGKKSLAFALAFQSADRTLTDAEADEAFRGILSAVAAKFHAELRA